LDPLRWMLLLAVVGGGDRDDALVLEKDEARNVLLPGVEIFEFGDRQLLRVTEGAAGDEPVPQAEDEDVEIGVRYVAQTALNQRILARAVAVFDDALVGERVVNRLSLRLEVL